MQLEAQVMALTKQMGCRQLLLDLSLMLVIFVKFLIEHKLFVHLVTFLVQHLADNFCVTLDELLVKNVDYLFCG